MENIAMVSLPMAGKDEKEIRDTWNRAVEALKSKGYDVIDTLFDYNSTALEDIGVVNEPLFYLAKSMEMMSKCTTIYFCNGWDNARGCILEHGAAKAYGLNIIYESDCE